MPEPKKAAVSPGNASRRPSGYALRPSRRAPKHDRKTNDCQIEF